MTHKEIVAAVEKGDLLLVKAKPFSPLSDDIFNKYAHITGRGWPGSFHSPVEREIEPLPVSKSDFRPPLQEPGFYVVPKSTTVAQLKATLFSSQYPAVMNKFDALNPGHLRCKCGFDDRVKRSQQPAMHPRRSDIDGGRRQS